MSEPFFSLCGSLLQDGNATPSRPPPPNLPASGIVNPHFLCYAICHMVEQAYTAGIAERWAAVSKECIMKGGAVAKVVAVLELMRRRGFDTYEEYEDNQAYIQLYMAELLKMLEMSADVQECITLYHRQLMMVCEKVSEPCEVGGVPACSGWRASGHTHARGVLVCAGCLCALVRLGVLSRSGVRD